MDAFATVDDLIARWRPLTTEEQTRAEVLLADATLLIRAACKKSGVDLSNPDEMLAALLVATTCSVVKRAMMAPPDAASVSAAQMSAGPYQESLTYVKPAGDLYLTKSEKSALGCGRMRIGSVQAALGGECHEG
jgi:hypothetical protein